MTSSKLAFPGWVMGQVLLPEQFQAQQEAIVAHMALRADLLGLPAHGLARLRLDEDLLAAGSLSVERLTYAFGSGLVIDVPGNTVLTNANLDNVATEQVAVYLHVRGELRDATDLSLYEDDPRSLRRVIYRGELSLLAQLDDARESVKLMELIRQDTGWRLGPYAPPLVRTGGASSPFLRDSLASSQRAVLAVDAQLARRVKDALLGREQVSELRRVRAAAARVLALLADHGVGAEPHSKVSLHPYALFTGLRDFFLEALILQEHAQGLGPLAAPRYRHDDLAGCFEQLRRGIDSMLGASSLSSNRLEFERRASWYVAGPFPDSLRESKDVFLILKSRTGDPVTLDGVKLASPRRIDEVYTRALSGVSLTPMNATTAASFAQTYGYDAVFYDIDDGDAEWGLVVRDGELCFPAWRELESVSAALVWG